MNLSFLTPQGTQKLDDVTEVTLPTTSGEITVLKNHEPLITQLVSGVIETRTGGKKETFASFDGFAKITGDEVKVFSAGVEHADSLDEAKIQESIKRAEELKKEKVSDIEFAAAAAQLERELARLKTVRRRRTK